MASFDKTSVREKVDEIRAEFSALRDSNKISKESIVLFQSLFMIIELILSIFLERNTKKNSNNSSKPSSQTGKDETAIDNQKTNGKGKTENNKTANNMRTVETTTTLAALDCEICGADLSHIPTHTYERRTKIDIWFEKSVEYVDAEIKECIECQSTTTAKFPEDMPGPLQYGQGIKAFVINLLCAQMIALGRVQKMVKTLIGIVISEATLLNFVLRLHLALEGW